MSASLYLLQVHINVGKVSDTGLHGAVALKDFEVGEAIISVPQNLSVELAPSNLLGTVNSHVHPPSSLLEKACGEFLKYCGGHLYA